MAAKGLILLLFFSGLVSSNVEKTIFLAPEAREIAHDAVLLGRRLPVLTPSNWSLRTKIDAEFPTEGSSQGKVSWFFLDNLTEYQRYEVRICWAATQPTAFTLKTYEPSVAWEQPDLRASIERFVPNSQQQDIRTGVAEPTSDQPRISSALVLQVSAAADYFTKNATLMSNVPLVDVDVVLDPYILNVFPRSLLPNAACIVLVAIGSFFVSRWVIALIDGLLRADAALEKKQQ
ncbi:hypothetical protein VTK73DRAFT_7036 [Phialemonium thermophilum]|uniref:Uncharacterized protein n=1 Tax=Phialemonium thermophilum TaxID=223376 RepID=A0ABR3XTT3_9PEZI